MIKRICISTLLAASLVLMATPVWAGYYAHLIVTETSGNSYTNLALNYSMDVTNLQAEGYITSGLDTRITDAGGYLLPHMLADDKVLWVGDVYPNSETQFVFWVQQDELDSMPTIAGHGGYVTIVDDPNLEPGDVYAFGVVGYVNVEAGADKNIIRKDGALTFNVTAPGELTFAVEAGNSLVAGNLTSGLMDILVLCDGTDMWMVIDEEEVDRTAASAVVDTATMWYLFENNVMPYVYFYGQWVVT